MLTLFVIVSTLVMLFMAFIWSKDSTLNLTFKMMFMALFVWGVICSLMRFGFGFHP